MDIFIPDNNTDRITENPDKYYYVWFCTTGIFI